MANRPPCWMSRQPQISNAFGTQLEASCATQFSSASTPILESWLRCRLLQRLLQLLDFLGQLLQLLEHRFLPLLQLVSGIG